MPKLWEEVEHQENEAWSMQCCMQIWPKYGTSDGSYFPNAFQMEAENYKRCSKKGCLPAARSKLEDNQADFEAKPHFLTLQKQAWTWADNPESLSFRSLPEAVTVFLYLPLNVRKPTKKLIKLWSLISYMYTCCIVFHPLPHIYTCTLTDGWAIYIYIYKLRCIIYAPYGHNCQDFICILFILLTLHSLVWILNETLLDHASTAWVSRRKSQKLFPQRI